MLLLSSSSKKTLLVVDKKPQSTHAVCPMFPRLVENEVSRLTIFWVLEGHWQGLAAVPPVQVRQEDSGPWGKVEQHLQQFTLIKKGFEWFLVSLCFIYIVSIIYFYRRTSWDFPVPKGGHPTQARNTGLQLAISKKPKSCEVSSAWSLECFRTVALSIDTRTTVLHT